MAQTIVMMMGVAFMLVGIVTTGIMLRMLVLAIRSRRWPFVMGRLQRAGLKTVEYIGQEPDGGSDSARMAAVDFAYEYEVDGRHFQGRRVTFSDHVSKTQPTLERLVEEFRQAGHVRVFYDPKHPQRSVLLPGPRLTNYSILLTTVAFFLVGLYLFNLDLASQ